MAKKNVGAKFDGDDDVHTLANTPMPSGVRKAVAKVERKVWIELGESEEIPPTGQFFQVNGKSFMLRAGEPALVPQAIINILEDAVASVPQVDPITRQVVGYKRKLRFPYSMVQAPEKQAA